MKSIIVFLDVINKYSSEKCFNNQTAQDLSNKWALELQKTYNSQIKTISLQENSLTELLQKLCEQAQDANADFIIFAFNDLPFLNLPLTKKLIENHITYKNEYTFADGYPYGFSPEIIDSGTLKILLELSKTTQMELGQKKVTRTCIFDLIKTDINSFDVESELADEDWRLLRFSFDLSKKENYLRCKALFNMLPDNISELDLEDICGKASKNVEILKTVPAFYNIQITEDINSTGIYNPYPQIYKSKKGNTPQNTKVYMDYKKFCTLVDEIAEYSEEAVISLSCFGEALLHPDFLSMVQKVLSYSGLSVFIETDGLLINDNICNSLKTMYENAVERTNGWDKIMIAVTLDAFSSDMYKKIRVIPDEKDVQQTFETAKKAVISLCQALPSSVYPQFTRMNSNEDELEAFYRYWSNKENQSFGNLIIQKYNDFCGLLKNEKPADLSPLERNVCWHLRRDMSILCNGDVPVCFQQIYNSCVGNVFNEGIKTVWEKTNNVVVAHCRGEYDEKCKKCDEYYTFNF